MLGKGRVLENVKFSFEHTLSISTTYIIKKGRRSRVWNYKKKGSGVFLKKRDLTL
jgi:ferredoxin-like protein FixX